MKVFSNIIVIIATIGISISGNFSDMVITPGKNNVHVKIDKITDEVSITVLWRNTDGVIFPGGRLEIAPRKYDRQNGHCFYTPWGCLSGNGSNVVEFPATCVKVTTNDGGDSGWMPLTE